MTVIQKLTPEQIAIQACNPVNSVVIEACAGSGKTWLLVSRIFRLLLSGVKPQEILAITFTRKAAQEMKARLEKFLEEIEGLSDAELMAELSMRGVETQEALELLPKARGLFETILSDPKKISIDTFHGWFSRICQAAPVGVGVPQGATLREDVKRLLDDSLASWWSQLGEAKGGFAQLRTYYEELLSYLSPMAVEKILTSGSGIVHQRAAWMRFVMNCQRAGINPLSVVKEKLPLVGLQDPLEKAIEANLNWRELPIIAKLLQQGGANDIKYGQAIAEGCAAFESGNSLDVVAQKLHSGFLTGDFTLYSTIDKCSGAVQKYLKASSNEAWLDQIPAIRIMWGEILISRQEWLKQNQLFAINRAWMALGESMSNHYQEAKEFSRVQDFSDLEWQASRLMEDESSSAYLQARLDARYKHILIDEFQDTNPLQWQILQGWLAGYGASGHPPKIFIVGDPKQSIYRFRGADARLFDVVKDVLSKDFEAKCLNYDDTRRNSNGVLDAVNKVFEPLIEIAYPYRTQTTLWKPSEGSADLGAAYRLPLIAYEEAQPEPLERAALSHSMPERNNVVPAVQRYKEALRVGNLIREFQRTKIVFDEQDGKRISRPAQWGDFLILIKRKRYLPEIEKAFRELGLPCDSPRQGGLLQTLEADDLGCLLEVLLTPANDLALAQVLRSPIFSIDEVELQALADQYKKDRHSWWQALAKINLPRLKEAYLKIKSWMDMSQKLPVHDLLDHIYDDGNVRYQYAISSPALERERVLSNLDAFLVLALDVDGGRYPSLSRFIEELRSLKRGYQEESPDEGDSIEVDAEDSTEAANSDLPGVIRLMTIHSAKGLEAPFVFLLDTNTDPNNKDHSGMVIDWDPQASAPSLVCAYATKLSAAGIEDALKKEATIASQESWNLLYVAMTRAKQELYISGVAGKSKSEESNGLSKNSWYSHLSAVGIAIFENEPECTSVIASLPQDLNRTDAFSFQDFGHGTWRAPTESVLFEKQLDSIGQVDSENLDLGTALHLVLQHLSPGQGNVSKGRIDSLDSERLANWLNLPLVRVREAVRIAKNILGAENLTQYFDPDSYLEAWNELDVLDDANRLFRIDRLVELKDHLMILDYKLSIPSPESELFAKYQAQIRNYKVLLQRLRHDKSIRACLIDQMGNLVEIT